MSSNPIEVPVESWEGITGSLDQLREGGQELEQFVGGLLDELDQLHGQLLQQEKELEREYAQFRQDRSDAASSADGSQHLLDELTSVRRQCAELQQERDALAAQRDDLLRRQEELQARVENSGAADERLAAAQAEWDGQRNELQAQLAAAREEAQRAAAERKALDESSQREQQRVQRELTQLRRTVNEQTIELRALRAAKGATSPAQKQKPASKSKAAPLKIPTEPPKVLPASEVPSDDSVLESVMAQFEMIQKDIVRRRARSQEERKP